MRREETRDELRRLVNQRPFNRFIINMDSGDRLAVEHPENLAFDASENGATRFYLISQGLTFTGMLEAISHFAYQDVGQVASA